MTEQEAIKYLKDANRNNQMIGVLPKSDVGKCLINALEEVQQYRAIGTPDECRAAVEKQKAKKPIIEYEQTHDCVTEIEWKCPVCGTNYVELAPCGEWCRYCGTKLDWGDEE